MNRSDVSEFHYITAIANLPSILEQGILSHRRASQLEHASIAMPEIQQRRERRVVPGGQPLHEYVNLYFHARNPMLYLRKVYHQDLCILRISPNILDIPGAIIADGNASSDYTRFWPSPEGLHHVDRELVFAEYWTDENEILGLHKKRTRCAEILVPNQVAPGAIVGAYVSSDAAQTVFHEQATSLAVQINAYLFFR